MAHKRGIERVIAGWIGLTLMLLAGVARAQGLPAWDFGKGLGPWRPSGELTKIKSAQGVTEFDDHGRDSFLTNRTVNFAATPWQYVHVRLKADHSGEAQLFWSGTMAGKFSGLSEAKSQRIHIIGDNQWHEYDVLPGWQREGTIRQMRFDTYDGAHFAIGKLEVLTWGGAKPVADRASFTPGADGGLQPLRPGSPCLMAPPLRLALEGRGWVSIKARSSVERQAAVLWSAEGQAGLKRTAFTVHGDGAAHTYNLELKKDRAWKGNLAVLGLEAAAGTPGELTIESLALGAAPVGPPELAVEYFGFENAINRSGRECRVLAKVVNRGATSGPIALKLGLPAGVRCATGELTRPVPALGFGEDADVTWPIIAEREGAATVTVSAVNPGPGAPAPATAGLAFDPALSLPKAAYVPAPQPIETSVDVCMYYFPGWQTAERWDPIRKVAPIRKPLLGYYDEANPECVDWQIKWARENGIGCFLLDWYWNKGGGHLEHWLKAYRQARYRDQLKIAIMWANHNPPGSHSRADWRKVTQWWIDNVFALKGYFKVGGKPAVFIWAPDRARQDMGGSAEFRAALEESQGQARAAGYAGITFIAVNNDETPALAARLAEEGFAGTTNYHEFAKAPEMAPSRAEVQYKDLVATAPGIWETRQARQPQGITYYPLIDTGWDARPWHGSETMVMSGRNPELWEKLLRAALKCQQAHPKAFVVMGPANEWGEGSYIEPNLEFGFKMYETVRKVFGKGDPAKWPQNYGPADVGLGPYDIKKTETPR